MFNLLSTNKGVKVRAILAGQFKDENIVPSYIRLDQELITGQSRYQFDVLNGNVAYPGVEQRLDRNDRFYITHLGFFISEILRTEYQRGVLFTYPSDLNFIAHSTAGAQAWDYETVYNGKFSFKVGQITYLPNFPMRSFRYVPQNQLGMTNAAIAGPVQYQLAIDPIESDKGFVEVPNKWLLVDGQETNECIVDLSLFAGCVFTNANVLNASILTFMPMGYLVKNASQVKKVIAREKLIK